MTAPQLRAPGSGDTKEEDICLFGETNFRNQLRRFGIKLDDRRRHMYVIGKTGMGKTTMMENMVLHDIYSGHGIGIVDPHGDFAEKIINYVPPERINDVVYLNPADTDFPIGFNILEVKNESQKHLVAAGLMGIFKKIWPDVWSSRMEYILNNTLLALLDYPGSTLLGINRLLADKDYRRKVVSKLTDPVIKSFWQTEFANYEPRYAKEAVAPIQNKIGQFLSASVIRNMVAQVKSTIDIRELMDSKKILVMNLSKGRIGEDNSRLLGGMLITKIQLAAMERVDTPEEDRKDFFLYVDEFQNFATPSFANILSEARKYRLSLIMAHQYIKQLDEIVGDAVFGNVGTIVTFRVGGPDAEVLVKEFTPTFLEEDIVNLAKFNVYLKLMINGVASLPFSASTMAPIGKPTGSAEKVIRVSRERYGKEKFLIEEKITRWSGLELGHDDEDDEGAVKESDPVGSKTGAPKRPDDRQRGGGQSDKRPSRDASRDRAFSPRTEKKPNENKFNNTSNSAKTISLVDLTFEPKIKNEVRKISEPKKDLDSNLDTGVGVVKAEGEKEVVVVENLKLTTATLSREVSKTEVSKPSFVQVKETDSQKKRRRRKRNRDRSGGGGTSSAIRPLAVVAKSVPDKNDSTQASQVNKINDSKPKDLSDKEVEPKVQKKEDSSANSIGEDQVVRFD